MRSPDLEQKLEVLMSLAVRFRFAAWPTSGSWEW